MTFQQGLANKVLAQDRWANPPPVGKAMAAGVREAVVLVCKVCKMPAGHSELGLSLVPVKMLQVLSRYHV